MGHLNFYYDGGVAVTNLSSRVAGLSLNTGLLLTPLCQFTFTSSNGSDGGAIQLDNEIILLSSRNSQVRRLYIYNFELK